MKKSLFIFLLLTMNFLYFNNVQAQNYILGYTNVDYILSLMPEMKGIEQEIKDYGSQLRMSLEKKSQDFQVSVSKFQENAEKMNEVERNSKQRELAGTQENLVKMQQDSEQSLQKKQIELLDPLYKKIQTKVKEVRKQKGYAMIINESVNGVSVIIDVDPKYDITTDVLKKLGITPPSK